MQRLARIEGVRRPARKRLRVLHWCLQKWIIVYLGRVASRSIPGQAHSLASVFTAWHQFAQRCTAQHLLARLHHRRHATRCTLTVWLRSYNLALSEQIADRHEVPPVLAHAFRRWQRRQASRGLQRTLLRTWRLHLSCRRLLGACTRVHARCALRRWRQTSVRDMRVLRRALATSQRQWAGRMRRDVMLARVAIGTWRGMVDAMRECDEIVDRRYALNLGRRALTRWRTRLRVQSKIALAVEIVESVGVRQRRRGCWRAWERFVRDRRMGERYAHRLEMACRRVRWAVTIRPVVRHWRTACHLHRVTASVFNVWKQFANDSRRSRHRVDSVVTKLTNGLGLEQWRVGAVKSAVVRTWVAQTAVRFALFELSRLARMHRTHAIFQRWRSTLLNR